MLERIHYQTFEELNNNGSSKSREKFNIFKNKVTSTPGQLLDIGCNHGYFCFNITKCNHEIHCDGIDMSKSCIQVATHLNNVIFKQPNTTFKQLNIVTEELDKQYDKIICLSTFHYFREQQLAVLKKIYNSLNVGGIFILEAGLAKLDKLGIVEQKQRGVERQSNSPAPHFPSRTTLVDWLTQTGFKITETTPSVNQQGCENPRTCFICCK